MLISREKRDKNYAEYILYMWQVEDLIRANNCDISQIKKTIIPQYETDVDEETKQELVDWWDNLAEMMKIEKKEKSGHLQILINSVNEMNHFHSQLLSSTQHLDYQMKFSSVLPMINELKTKIKPEPQNDIEAMLTVIYLSIMMKIKGDKITDSTNQAIKVFSEVLALLSKLYKDDEEGKIEWNLNEN